MTRAQKTWLIAGFIILDAIIVVLVLAWVLRDPYRASQAQQAQVSDARQPGQSDTQASDLEIVTFESAELMFTGSSALGEQPGFFEQVSGEAGLGEDGSLRTLRGTVQMASVLTNADSLTAKLKKEPGMFEVDKYPTANFVSTAIRPAGPEQAAAGATHDIEGNLTVRGVTRSLTFPAKITVAPDRVTLDAEFSVNRLWFGVDYDGGAAFPEIRELVLINLNIEAPRQPAADTKPPSNPSEQ